MAATEVAWYSAIDDVKADKIDLTGGGPMRVMMDHDTTENDEHRLLSLSESVEKDPFCLLGNRPNISLHDLPTLRMSIARPGR